MARYVAFLRAVNIGKRKVPMALLRDVLADAGFTEVETHIQTGNVLVTSRARSSARVAEELEGAMRGAFGFDIPAILRTPADLVQLVESAPSSPFGDRGRHYVSLLRDAPTPEAAAAVAAWDVDGEALALVGRDVHQWFEKPYNEVKASNAAIEKLTSTVATNRNWAVMSAVAAKWG